VLRADATRVISYDVEEFAGIRWLAPRQVLAEPSATLDPHLHRFIDKLLARLNQPRGRSRYKTG
jgi:hypothetical protein